MRRPRSRDASARSRRVTARGGGPGVLARKVAFTNSTDERRQRVELPFEPRALVCWWALTAAGEAAPPNRGGIGFATGTGAAAAVAWASDSGGELTRSGSWLDDGLVVALNGATAAGPILRADLAAVDADGFTLEWTATSSETAGIHCLALGGSDIVASAVGTFRVPDSPRRQAVHQIGFRPDLILLAPTVCESPKTLRPGLVVSFGAAAVARGQAASAFASADGGQPGTVAGCQRLGAAVVVPDPEVSRGLAALGLVSSFDPDGFTIDWSRVRGAGAVAYLAIAGGRYAVGVGSMPLRRPARRSRVSGLDPAAVLTATWGLSRGDESRRIARLCLGAASSPADVGCTIWAESNHRDRAAHTLTRSSGSRLITVPDTRPAASGTHAEATLESIHPGGFVLRWPIAEGLRRQFIYVALGNPMRRRIRRIVDSRPRRGRGRG